MFSWLLYCYSGFCNAFCVEFRNVHPYLPPMPMSPSASITRNLSLTVFAFFDIPFPPRGRLLGPDVGGSATETGVAAPDGFAFASSKCPSPVKVGQQPFSDLVANRCLPSWYISSRLISPRFLFSIPIPPFLLFL